MTGTVCTDAARYSRIDCPLQTEQRTRILKNDCKCTKTFEKLQISQNAMHKQ